MTALSTYLREAASRPFAYGERDCGMVLAGWVLAQTGRDPAAPLRGRYRTRLGWMRLAARAGGLAALVGPLLEAAGLRRVAEPAAGDVGVVRLGAIGETCAIRTGRGWAVKVNDGISILSRAEIVAAWSFRELT